MIKLNFYTFAELDKDAQDRAVKTAAKTAYEALQKYGFTNMKNRRPALLRIEQVMKTVLAAHYLEDGTEVALPARALNPELMKDEDQRLGDKTEFLKDR